VTDGAAGKELNVRLEQDSLGEVSVPADALWGAHTQRAIDNFPISGVSFGRRFIGALGRVKSVCARANVELGVLDPTLGAAIVRACDEVVDGVLDDHFPVDVFQTGSGTSTNMNANEVIARRADQFLVEDGIDSTGTIHPNDHVNLGQSSNDVIPTVLHVALTLALRDALIPNVYALGTELHVKAEAFDHVVKTGRTHLQDATPIRMGQVFGGFATQAYHSVDRLQQAVEGLCELPLGGTAVGTGMNCPQGMPALAIGLLNAQLGTQFVEASDHVEANAARDAAVEASGHLKTVAVSLHKIANDIRLMASGPRAGLGELRLPAVQPGSSIMPGKVNPVMAEALIMACAQVIGSDAAVTLGGLGGYFELNLMMPLLAHNLITGADILANAVEAFRDRCVRDIEVNAERCQAVVTQGLALATALAPVIGYDQAAEIAKEARRTGRTIAAVASERLDLPETKLQALLDPARMTEPGLLEER
jgi:fumarate hydratase class II